MAKPPKLEGPQAQAAALGIPERLLLFCIASKTEWERVVLRTTVTAMVVRGLIERAPAGELALTKQGRAVFAALLGEDDE
jgi:hypothetical protein